MKLDHKGHPYLIWTYWELTPGERLAHFESLGASLTRHKKAYYAAGEATINDFEYDFLERVYEAVAEDLGREPVAVNQVGFKE